MSAPPERHPQKDNEANLTRWAQPSLSLKKTIATDQRGRHTKRAGGLTRGHPPYSRYNNAWYAEKVAEDETVHALSIALGLVGHRCVAYNRRTRENNSKQPNAEREVNTTYPSSDPDAPEAVSEESSSKCLRAVCWCVTMRRGRGISEGTFYTDMAAIHDRRGTISCSASNTLHPTMELE